MARMFDFRIIHYGIIGLFSSLIHISTASLFVRFIYESLVISNIIGFSCAFCFSYVAQSKFVFTAPLSCKKALKFLLVQMVALVLAVKTVQLTENISIYTQIFMVAFILPVCAFCIHKLWTFAEN